MNVSKIIKDTAEKAASFGFLGEDLVKELLGYAHAMIALEDHPVVIPAPYHFTTGDMIISPRTPSAGEQFILSAAWGDEDRVLFIVEDIRKCTCGSCRIDAMEMYNGLRTSMEYLHNALLDHHVELVFIRGEVEWAMSMDGDNVLSNRLYNIHQAGDVFPQYLNEVDQSEGLINTSWLKDVVELHTEDDLEAVNIYGQIFK